MDQQKKMIEEYIHAYNQFEIESMLILLHEDVVFENFSEGICNVKTEGIDEFRLQAQDARKYFSKRTQTIKEWDIQIDKIIVKIAYEGILAIDLPNGMKAGDCILIEGQSEFMFTDTKISKIVDRS
ncbi:nuclear transport factor 2 family protein [Marinifilum sp.]|uniref:nuclear transport factor 2 family protein n=1 Tax=Marinifilum sp. TaxID=2033137 RepID=UPI003BACC667